MALVSRACACRLPQNNADPLGDKDALLRHTEWGQLLIIFPPCIFTECTGTTWSVKYDPVIYSVKNNT